MSSTCRYAAYLRRTDAKSWQHFVLLEVSSLCTPPTQAGEESYPTGLAVFNCSRVPCQLDFVKDKLFAPRPNIVFMTTSGVLQISAFSDYKRIELDTSMPVQPPLISILQNHREKVSIFLARGVNIESRNECGKTALFVALERGDEENVILLLDRGADVFAEDKNGLCCLHMILQSSNYDIACLVLRRLHSINIMNKNGDTPMHLAIRPQMSPGGILLSSTSCYLALKIMELGADINLQNKKGNTPLHETVICKNFDSSRLLLGSDANANLTNQEGLTVIDLVKTMNDENFKNIFSRFDISYQVLIGSDRGVKWALERGAHINSVDDSGRPLISIAVATKNIPMVHLLIHSGANIDACDKEGETPLMMAVKMKYSDMSVLLIDFGASLHSIDNAGNSPLHLAAGLNSSHNLAKLLLDKRAVIDAKNNLQMTPLHVAAGNHDAKMLSLLLERGADINARDNYLRTVLFFKNNGLQNVQPTPLALPAAGEKIIISFIFYALCVCLYYCYWSRR